VSFATITLYVASQRVFIVIVYFVIDLVRKRLDKHRICVCVFLPAWSMRFSSVEFVILCKRIFMLIVLTNFVFLGG
jgi:hypothetical protein